MPQRPQRNCSYPGCRNLVDTGRCEKHLQRTATSWDVARGTAHERGYSYRWKKYRDWFIKQSDCPECGRNHILCEGQCRADGRVVAAYAVDHIIPHRGDQTLFWEHSNLQSLCQYEHGQKSISEQLERIDK